MSRPWKRSLGDLDPRSHPDSYGEFLMILQSGGVVAYPAETMYGLGAIGPDPANEARVNDLKGRSPKSPLIYLTDSWSRCALLCEDPAGQGEKLAGRFWPGPLTIVLPRRDGQGTIAFRHPRLPAVVRWVRDLDTLLSSTSANRSGDPPAVTERALLASFGASVDAVVLGGDFAPRGTPSTVVAISKEGFSVLRQGSIGESALRAP